jgi:hypothetical protein
VKRGKRSHFKKVTIEIGDFVDKHFVKAVKENLGLTTNQQINDLLIHKWSAVSTPLAQTTSFSWGCSLCSDFGLAD